MRAPYGLIGIIVIGLMQFVFVSTPAAAAVPQTLDEWFHQGNEWYRKGDFEKAVRQYQMIIDSGYDSAVLEYNLGNAEVHRNNLAQALVHYDRAAVFGLRDPDWRANQGYVLRKLGWPKGHPSANHPVWMLSLHGWMTAATVLLWIGLALVALAFLLKRAGWMRWTGLAAVVLGLFCVGTWFWQWSLIRASWIVVRPSAARFEPREEATVHYALRPGEVVYGLRVENDWIKVRSRQGRLGWVPLSHVEVMDPYQAFEAKKSFRQTKKQERPSEGQGHTIDRTSNQE